MKIIFPKNQFWISLSVAFLLLLYTNLTKADEGNPLRPKRVTRYHYEMTSYDLGPKYENGRYGDGKYDTFIYQSYDRKPILKKYDFNYDGATDTVQEWIRIENLEIETRDRDFDGRVDFALYTYPKRQYLFKDENQDGAFDYLAVKKCEIKKTTCFDGREETYTIYVPVFQIASLNEPVASSSSRFLREMLTQYNLKEEFDYILSEFVEKREELQKLLDNQDWENLFTKTIEYLDLPSKLPMQIFIVRPEDMLKQNQHFKSGNAVVPAYVRFPNIFILSPKHLGNDLNLWLKVVDHEILHAVQNQRIFYYIHQNKTKATWDDCLQHYFNRNDWIKFRTPPLSEEDLKMIVKFADLPETVAHVELEAYLFQIKRVYLYNPPDLDGSILERMMGAHIYKEIIEEKGWATDPFFDYVMNDAKDGLPPLSNRERESHQYKYLKSCLLKLQFEK